MDRLFIDEEHITLIRELGEGSYGKVYAGECLKKPVAVKVIGRTKLSKLTKEEFEELEREMLIMTESLHGNITLAMGISTYEERLAIVMELLDGDLDTLLIKNAKEAAAKLSLYQRLLMARDAALGMNWLHSREPAIIHRDLKLENLMYKKNSDSSYVIKIADFGLAVVKPKKKKTLVGRSEGTPVTMAPEIMQEKPFTQKADVYSFGLCLWQIVTLQRLFPDAKPDKFINSICVKGERPPISSALRESNPELVELIECCWDGDQNARPSFHEILQKLDDILVDTALPDLSGQYFWKASFQKIGVGQNIPWGIFWESLSEYLGIPQKAAATPEICFKVLIQDCHKDNKKTETVNIESFGHFLLWYGPLDPQNQGNRDEQDTRCSLEGDRRTSQTIARRIEALIRAPWFHGMLVDPKEPERKLEDKEANTFLVRCSSSPGYFAVTRVVKKGQRPQSSRLAQSKRGFMVEGVSSDNVHYYDSLCALIETTLVAQFNWKHCPGSPFTGVLSSGDEDPLGGSYQPLIDGEI